jgi:dihydrofolate reductase
VPHLTIPHIFLDHSTCLRFSHDSGGGILDEKPKHVVSRREPVPGWKAQRIDASADSIRALKSGTSGMLLLAASPALARTLVEWELVDEYHVAISPMLAGPGPRFLEGLRQELRATLQESQRLHSGVVIHRYRLTV